MNRATLIPVILIVLSRTTVLFVFQAKTVALTTEQMSQLTNDHEQLLLLLDDVDLEHGAQARHVGQGVLDDIQGVEPLLRAHQHDLQGGQRCA